MSTVASCHTQKQPLWNNENIDEKKKAAGQVSLNIYAPALPKKFDVAQLRTAANTLLSNRWSVLGLFSVDLTEGLHAFSSPLCFSCSCGILHPAVPVHHPLPARHAAVLTCVRSEILIIWFSVVLIIFVLWIDASHTLHAGRQMQPFVVKYVFP